MTEHKTNTFDSFNSYLKSAEDRERSPCSVWPGSLGQRGCGCHVQDPCRAQPFGPPFDFWTDRQLLQTDQRICWTNIRKAVCRWRVAEVDFFLLLQDNERRSEVREIKTRRGSGSLRTNPPIQVHYVSFTCFLSRTLQLNW